MAVFLKRKRSGSELSLNSTTQSSPSRPTTGFDNMRSTAICDAPVLPKFHGSGVPLHLSSRTFKRFRNNRPSDTEVHQHTLSLLYTAQQPSRCQGKNTAQDAQAAMEQDGQADLAPLKEHSFDHPPTNQRSLHSFWNLARPVTHLKTAGESLSHSQVMEMARMATCDNEQYSTAEVGSGY